MTIWFYTHISILWRIRVVIHRAYSFGTTTRENGDFYWKEIVSESNIIESNKLAPRPRNGIINMLREQHRTFHIIRIQCTCKYIYIYI